MPKPSHTPVPQPPDEGDLLAWIEGEKLPRDRELAVAAALSQDPGLARKLELLRADRQALCSLPEIPAPAGLMEAVEAALQPMLERQMLVGLQDDLPDNSPLPISMVQPMRRSVFDIFLADRAGRRMAAAAAVLLMVGGISYFATSQFSGTTPARIVASKGAAENAADGTNPAAMSMATKTEPSSPEAAAVRSAGAEPIAKIADAAPIIAAAPAASEPAAELTADPAPMAITQLYGPPSPTDAVVITALEMDRAVELARESRLVIRLRTADPSVMAQPQRLTDRIRRAASPAWKLGGDVPAATLAILSPPTMPRIRPMERSVQPTAFAGMSDLAPGMYGPPRPEPLPPIPDIPEPKPAAFIVQTRLDVPALETLRNAISGRYGEVVFEELAEPLPLNETPSLNPAAVMWWSQSPTGWTRWADIPVVIDAFR